MSCVRTISRQSARNCVASWLSNEEIFNLSGFVIESARSEFTIHTKTSGIVAGVPFIDALVQEIGCQIEWNVEEGTTLEAGHRIASISGPTEELVHAEQLIKTILSRASGISTFASRLKQLLKDFSWKGELISPSNHTPGFSLVEEYALLVAGVRNSKSNSTVLLQPSHICAAGGIAEAVTNLKVKAGSNTQIKAECTSLADAKLAIEAGANAIRFDCLNAKDLGNFSAQLKSLNPNVYIEAAGNFDESTLRSFALQNIDALTSQKLCNGYPVIEFKVTYSPCVAIESSSQKRALDSQSHDVSADINTNKATNGLNQEPIKKARNDETEIDKEEGSRLSNTVKPKASPAVASDSNQLAQSPVVKVGSPSSTVGKFGQANAIRFNSKPRPQKLVNKDQVLIRQRIVVSDVRPLSSIRPNVHPMNTHPFQVGQRLMNPNPNLRNGLMSMSAGAAQQMTFSNAVALMSNPPNQPNSNFRLPGQQQRMGALQTMPQPLLQQAPFAGNFSTAPPQQLGVGNSGWPLLSNAAGSQALKFVGLQQSCRMCGTANPQGVVFCRNCRTSIR